MTQLRTVGTIAMLGGWLVAGAATVSADSSGQQTRTLGGVTYTSATHGGESVLAAEAQGVRVERRASTDGAGTILLHAGKDQVVVRMTAETLQITRGRVSRTLHARSLTGAEMAAVRAWLHDAPAVRAGAVLLARVGDKGPAPIVSALSFVRMLAGDAGSMQRVADTVQPPPGVRLVQHVASCWSSYQNSMAIFMRDLESCVYSHHWNYFLQQACGFTYLVQVELAWFGLISCAGGLPGL